MHIPPYYKRPSWQRFLAGAFIGAIIAFIVFIYMYGQFYEKWVEENLSMRARINELEKNNRVLEESKKELDEKSKQQITVKSITIQIENLKELKLERDSLMQLQLEEKIKEEILQVIGRDISSVSDNYQLLISTIENSTIRVDEFSYNAIVEHLFIKPELQINVELTIAN